MIDDDEAWEYLCAICVIIASIAASFLILAGVAGALIYYFT